MAYKIIKTKVFLNSVIDVLIYIENDWSSKSAFEFNKKLDKKIASISINPKIGAATAKKNNIRKLTITKHNKVYYRLKGNTITLLILFESKQNPTHNKYE